MRLDTSKEFVEDLLRSHQDEIVRGMMRAFYELPDASSDALISEMAAACRRRFLRMVDFPADTDVDGLIERMQRAGPGRIEITRSGDEIIWREYREGQCMCPLIRRHVAELQPKLCACSREWTRSLVETFHGGPVEAEIVESVATGSSDCVFRLTLGSASSKAS